MPRWLLPENISDALPAEARRIEELRRRLLDLYRGHGYELIAPPLIEHLDSLLTGVGSRLATRTFQTVDQLSGRTIGVRADITPQAARIDAHLLDRRGVVRLCYCGSVLHTRPASLLATREPIQVGAELFGHGGLEAELESMELVVRSLHAAGIDRIRIDIGHAAIVPALLEHAREAGCWGQSAPFGLDELYGLLLQKDIAGLRELLLDFPAAIRDPLLRLPDLYGSVSAHDLRVLEVARANLPTIPRITAALDDIAHIARSALWERLSGVRLAVDLADLQGYHYYSGPSFAAFAAPGPHEALHAEALARGGRYDGVGAAFGRARPATGFSLELRTLAELGRGANGEGRVGAISAPWGDDASLREAIARLRQAGEIVVQALPGHPPEHQEFDCDRELTECAGQWNVVPRRGTQ